MNKKQVLDFAERVAATFFQAFLAVVLVHTWTGGSSDLVAAETAAVAGALAAAKFAQVQLAKYLSKPEPQ